MHLSVVFSKGLSLSQCIFSGIVLWVVSGVFQWNFTFVISGVLSFAPNLVEGVHGLRADEARRLVHPGVDLGLPIGLLVKTIRH